MPDMSDRLKASFLVAANLGIDNLAGAHAVSQLNDEEVAAVLTVGDDRDNAGQKVREILAKAETRRCAAAAEEARHIVDGTAADQTKPEAAG
jgi:hypothetical protein